MAKPIKESLGLGEIITFSDGTQLACVPACLVDLEDAMQHWSVFAASSLNIQGAYIPGNEKVKEAFEELLFIACGRRIPKEELRRKVRVTDGGREVTQFIDRFLGLVPRNAGTGNDNGNGEKANLE